MSSELFYQEKFKQTIEDHLSILKANRTTQPIEAYLQNQCRNNFYLLLNNLNVPFKYHWIVLRVNDLHSPLDYTGTQTFIHLPEFQYVDRLMQVYNTKSESIF